MGSEVKQRNFARIPVDKAETGPSQARTRKVDRELDELIESMRRWGLIHPIRVYGEDDKYIVLAGQRRLRAAQELGWSEIDAEIVEKPDDLAAKAVSFSETVIRTDLPDDDIRDALILFYRRYDTVDPLCQELGIPRKKGTKLIQKHIPYETLPDELKPLVDEGKIDLRKDALPAMRAATLADGTVDSEKAKIIALGLKALNRDQRRSLRTIAAENPALSGEEILEEAKRPPAIREYLIHLPLRVADAVEQAAEKEGRTPEEWLETAIHESAARAGYL